MTTPQVRADHVAQALGISGLDIRWDPSASPGGDPNNIAFVRSGPDLRQFTIEYDFDDCDESEIRRTIVHELLHIALRHVAAAVKIAKANSGNAVLAATLEQALEEDTEALAESLQQVMTWTPAAAVVPIEPAAS